MESSTEERRVIIRSRRELEPYGDLILKLLARPGMKFNDLPAALAEQGIYANEKIIRSVREGLNQRRYIRRDHKERMIGIYRKWKSRDVVIKYEGKIQAYAKLKRTIAFRGKRNLLDEQDLIRLEGYTGPTPKEIYYFDPSDPNTNLLEADGCDWDPAEKDEALRYIAGSPTGVPYQMDLQIRMSPTSRASRLTAFPTDSPDHQNEPIDSILPIPDHALNSILEGVDLYDYTHVLSGDESHPFRTSILDLYANFSGDREYDLHRIATLSDQFLDRGMFDEAENIASTAVILTERLYGSSDARSLLAAVNLGNVRTQQGFFHEAYQIGETAVKGLKDARGDYDGDMLQSECRFCETLLELGQLDRAKTLCCDVLRRSVPDFNVTDEMLVSFKLQLAKICNARAEYLEAKELLEHIVRDRYNRFGMSDERTLRASIELVHSLRGLEDWEAITTSSQLEREIKRREAIGIPREMWTLELVHSLGVQQYNLGAYFEAEKVFRDYFECLRRIIRLPSHPRLICAESWIANSLYHQGKNKEAGAINTRLLIAAEDTWGPHHRITLALMSNLAWTMEEGAVFAVFETHMFKVRDLSIKHLGEDDHDTLDSERFCAYVKTIRGEWDESLAALEKLHHAQKKRSDPRSRVEVLKTLLASSKILSRSRQDSKAESLLRQALDLGALLFGSKHPRALVPLAPLASTLARLGRYSEAEKLLSEGISTLAGSLGRKHFQVMEMEMEYAEIMWLQNKHADAAELQSRVLKEYTKTYGNDHPYVIGVTGRLASCYAEQNMVVEAQTLFERAIKSCQLTFGPEHRRRCNLELSLAEMFRDQRNLTKALNLGQTILEVAQSSFGTIEAKSNDSTSYLEHPYSLRFLEALAITYTRLGDITRSAELLEKTLAFRTKLQGPNHPDTIRSLSNLAFVYTTANEYLTAERLCRDAVERSTVAFGDWHARTVEAMLSHGRALRGLRSYTESNTIFNKVLDWIFKNQRGECHCDVAKIYKDIALLHFVQDRYDESVRFLNYALREYRKLKHQSAVDIMIDLCTCYTAMDAYSKAETQAEEAVREAEKTLGPDHPQAINARMQQASALLKSKKYVDVDELTKVLRQDIESHEGKHSTRLLEVEHTYGCSLQAQGRMNEAEAFLESCIHLRQHKDPRDPRLRELIRLLGKVKDELGKPCEKESILQNLLDRLGPPSLRDSLNGSLDVQLTTYAQIMEELATTQVSLQKYESAEALMKKVLDLRTELWGEGTQQVCDAERNLAKCIPDDRLLDRLKMQEEILQKYWFSTGLDMESSTPLLLDMADTCSSLCYFEYEVTIRERIIDLRPYPSNRDQQYVWDVQKLSWACHRLGQFEKAEQLLEFLDELIRVRFPDNLRDLAWTLQLLAQVKRALGKLGVAASTLEQSLLAGTQNPTEEVADNLNRLDLLVDLNMELGRWQEAKNSWTALLALREETQAKDWLISRDHWERLKLIDEKLAVHNISLMESCLESNN
ncbi:TPR-like protein [Stipitochalara longipes BDJ]|nr:TPR-like protein [Stipitochalara longipes BDJ]